MPLMKSASKPAFAHNIKAEVAAGKPVKQAVAIAYSVKKNADKAPGAHLIVKEPIGKAPPLKTGAMTKNVAKGFKPMKKVK